jgi:hypothetical protein
LAAAARQQARRIKPIDEAEYWEQLEFRVSREFSGMDEGHLRFFWCDGFLPTQYLLHAQSPCITGIAWICDGPRQEQWEFTLFLSHPVALPSEIAWSELLPPENVTEWMAIDVARKHMQIEPAAAVADVMESDQDL